MTTYTAVLDFPAALSAPHVCPWCCAALQPAQVDGQLAFLCPGCAEAWRFELGRAVRVPTVSGTSGSAQPCASD